jgi:hypothetical protein
MIGTMFAVVLTAGLCGAGVAVAVLYLDSHRFLVANRLQARQRAGLMWMLVGTGVAFAAALAVAVAFALAAGLGVAVVFGAATGIYAAQALWRALSRAF